MKSALPPSPSGGAGAAASRSSPIPSRAPRDKGYGVEELEFSSGFLSLVKELPLMKKDVLRYAFDLSACGGIEAAIGHLKAAGFNESQITMARELIEAHVTSR